MAVAERMPHDIDTVGHQPCLPNFSLNSCQRASLVNSDVISFVTLDLILWITFSAVMHVTLVHHVVRVFPDYNAFNVSGFRIPPDVVSDSELLHCYRSFQGAGRQAGWSGKSRTVRRRGRHGAATERALRPPAENAGRSIPQLMIRCGTMLNQAGSQPPPPKRSSPPWSCSSVRPRISIPRGVHGFTLTRSSTAKAAR